MEASGASSPGGKYSVRGVKRILGCALAVVGAAGAKSFFFVSVTGCSRSLCMVLKVFRVVQ